MKRLLLVPLLILAGCDPTKPTGTIWRSRFTPMTEEERKQVAAHAEKILSPPPASLSGDPDWDDSILVAHEEAKKIYCRETLWEMQYDGTWRDTGRWKYVDQRQSVQ